MKNSPDKTAVLSSSGIHQLQLAAQTLWRGIRQWCGDSAYESYLRSKQTKSCEAKPLTPTEFYLEQLNRKYSRPSRCC